MLYQSFIIEIFMFSSLVKTFEKYQEKRPLEWSCPHVLTKLSRGAILIRSKLYSFFNNLTMEEIMD